MDHETSARWSWSVSWVVVCELGGGLHHSAVGALAALPVGEAAGEDADAAPAVALQPLLVHWGGSTQTVRVSSDHRRRGLRRASVGLTFTQDVDGVSFAKLQVL